MSNVYAHLKLFLHCDSSVLHVHSCILHRNEKCSLQVPQLPLPIHYLRSHLQYIYAPAGDTGAVFIAAFSSRQWDTMQECIIKKPQYYGYFLLILSTSEKVTTTTLLLTSLSRIKTNDSLQHVSQNHLPHSDVDLVLISVLLWGTKWQQP